MRVFTDRGGNLVIDGEGITSIEVPAGIDTEEDVMDWMESRTSLPGKQTLRVKNFIYLKITDE